MCILVKYLSIEALLFLACRLSRYVDQSLSWIARHRLDEANLPTPHRQTLKRAMILGTCSYPALEDKGGLKWKVFVVLLKIIGGSAYEEFNSLGVFRHHVVN